MINYGYIIDNTFEVLPEEITWSFVRWNQDKTTTNYIGIETQRDLSDNPKVTIIGDNTTMRAWVYEYAPEEEY